MVIRVRFMREKNTTNLMTLFFGGYVCDILYRQIFLRRIWLQYFVPTNIFAEDMVAIFCTDNHFLRRICLQYFVLTNIFAEDMVGISCTDKHFCGGYGWDILYQQTFLQRIWLGYFVLTNIFAEDIVGIF